MITWDYVVISISKKQLISKLHTKTSQWAGAEEYADFIAAEG